MKVTFDNVYNAFQIIAPKGTMISFTGEPTALADGVYLVGDDGIINLDEQFLTDTLYLSTEGTDYAVTGGMRVTYPLGDETVIIRAGSSTIPFSKGAKGGGSGGDNTHYKGTTTTPISNGSTTNPITIDGEEYTAVFGDIAVYNYTEFVFDGTQWSEFGRPFDTTPTSGSANAVTSDGIYQRTPFERGTGAGARSAHLGDYSSATNQYSIAVGYYASASGENTAAFGNLTRANQKSMLACGNCNLPHIGDLFNVGNGQNNNHRSNIVEVNATSMNINGDIKQNNVSLRATTMPTITDSMLGKVVQYVGATDANYKKGWFYEAVSDGEETPTYSWVNLPTQPECSYSTSERVVDTWIDGSDLYQRTFEVTELVNGQWNSNVLGTSGINIVDVQGWIDWTYNGESNRRLELNYYFNSDDRCSLHNAYTDLNIYPYRTESGLGIDKAIITIKYTKLSAQANLMQTPTEEVSETPTTVEEDDMR